MYKKIALATIFIACVGLVSMTDIKRDLSNIFSQVTLEKCTGGKICLNESWFRQFRGESAQFDKISEALKEKLARLSGDEALAFMVEEFGKISSQKKGVTEASGIEFTDYSFYAERQTFLLKAEYKAYLRLDMGGSVKTAGYYHMLTGL